MIKDKRIGNSAMIVLIALTLSTVSVNGQTQSGAASKSADFSDTIESASRRAGKAFVEMVAKSTALTEKKMFKSFRLGSCQPATFAAPSISPPARSQPALSLCQP